VEIKVLDLMVYMVLSKNKDFSKYEINLIFRDYNNMRFIKNTSKLYNRIYMSGFKAGYLFGSFNTFTIITCLTYQDYKKLMSRQKSGPLHF
jgi:hypothetical protein